MPGVNPTALATGAALGAWLFTALGVTEAPQRVYDPTTAFGLLGPLLLVLTTILAGVAIYRTGSNRELAKARDAATRRADTLEEELGDHRRRMDEGREEVKRLTAEVSELKAIIAAAPDLGTLSKSVDKLRQAVETHESQAQARANALAAMLAAR